jgi:hypothetical protein
MNKIATKSLAILSVASNLEKKHKIITYASLLFLTLSTYFLRNENQVLKVEFAKLEQKNIGLVQNMVIFNRNYEGFPLPVWQKVKRGDKFIIQYINPTYVDFFGHHFDNDQFAVIGKTIFDLFPKNLAQTNYENDVAVSVTGKKLESIEETTDINGEKLSLRVIKWREIKQGKDTLIYGMVKEIIKK